MGGEVDVRKPNHRRTVIVKGLSDKRRGAPEAVLLYEETEESVKAREEFALQRAQMKQSEPDRRPNKRDRRLLSRFKREE